MRTASTMARTGTRAAATATPTADRRRSAATAAGQPAGRSWSAAPSLSRPPTLGAVRRRPLRKDGRRQRVQLRAQIGEARERPRGAHRHNALCICRPPGPQRAEGGAHQSPQTRARGRMASGPTDGDGQTRPALGRRDRGRHGQVQMRSLATYAATQHASHLPLPAQAVTSAEATDRSRKSGDGNRHGQGQEPR